MEKIRYFDIKDYNMSRSLLDVNQENIKIYGTKDNTYDDFPVGTLVKIICCSQDFCFFYGETGKVIRNGGRYLSIIVEYDTPRQYKDGTIEKSFNFCPDDLVIWNVETQEFHHEQERLKKLSHEERVKEEDNAQRSKRFMILDL